jgi:hypothetical protein
VLVDFLKANLDVFAWKPSDMKGIPRVVAEHKLNVKPGSKPVKQRLRRFNDEKCKMIGEEIKQLFSSKFMQKVFHPEWLANPVLVKKKNKKWRMYVDYMGLNKACPKDLFPLPRIDQVVDSTARYETLCLFSQCVLWVPPDSDVHSRPTCNLIHHSVQRVLLQDNALGLKNVGATCRAYTPGTHTRKGEDGLLLEFPCNPTRTPSM